ncbi:O-methyltransferase [Aspergillus clavatus NRRL 1]|uniref:O-methyltransferase, putative n=1 Tax=Aspergillus clavatus (strain ATCC 1007 / CBS 513.65 / DSM 816 / NCTC 3887 / NRRL 1 / QM 1276 / 107) TaxID=344612 RepID=A1C4G3_ASPCL|nr:O-methyltransferase, putative [Aspergillus clavatus NRRL 1]EAW15303.1 O-methyltransferase, putative [Aspergillus clavatus NRRL 1]
MRDACMLPFTKEQIVTTGDYCEAHSSTLPAPILAQIQFTDKLSKDEVVMAPSPAQCAWLMSFTQVLAPKRVLELGTFTGVSALIFHEATKKTQAEIVSMDMSETYLKYAEDAFRRHGATDRIRTVQGPCLEMLPTLTGQFDLIYIDAAEEEYEAYTRYILDHKLLSPEGVILVDDVLLEGLVVDRSIAKNFPEEIQQPYLAIADKMNAFNRYAATEPRVTATMIPVFNGVTQIMWK